MERISSSFDNFYGSGNGFNFTVLMHPRPLIIGKAMSEN